MVVWAYLVGYFYYSISVKIKRKSAGLLLGYEPGSLFSNALLCYNDKRSVFSHWWVMGARLTPLPFIGFWLIGVIRLTEV